MMNIKRLVAPAALVCAAALAGCSFDKNAVQEITTPDVPSSAVKFFNFGVGTPSVNFYANDTKLTAITSTTGAESTTGVAQGGTGNGGFYNALAPGQYTLTGKISAATDKDLAISNLAAQIADGKYYSYYISGIYNTTSKSAESFIVEDALPAFDPAFAYVRFVNAISNSTPQSLSVKHTTSGAVVAIGGATAYKAASGFIAIPPGTYDLTTGLVVRTGVSFANGRVYTIAARGDATISSTGTSANRPQLDNTANR